jgi:signal transduction histidine kinase
MHGKRMNIDYPRTVTLVERSVHVLGPEQGQDVNLMGISSDRQYLIAELSHQINSPLAAIRNALYLAGGQTEDPVVLRYLRIADEEISAIAMILRATRLVIEEVAENEVEQQVAYVRATRRAAA